MQAYARNISWLWDFEYPMHIPEILHQKLYNVSQAYSGNFQIVEYKILIMYSFPEIHQKILNIQELPETRRF